MFSSTLTLNTIMCCNAFRLRVLSRSYLVMVSQYYFELSGYLVCAVYCLDVSSLSGSTELYLNVSMLMCVGCVKLPPV